MSFINRKIEREVFGKLVPNKVLVLLGTRRVGKTELIKKILSKIKEPYLLLNGEDQATIEVLSNRKVNNYKLLLGSNKLLVIDEAQNIPNIGAILKLMVDELKGLKILVTGSSMFDLSNKLGEPLTGRQHLVKIYPFAQMEFATIENSIETKQKLEERLVLGSYPELQQINSWDDRVDYLSDLVNSYLLRDILEFEGIRKADKIKDLLRLLAYQVGKEVSIDELGKQLGLGKNTVERYLDLLCKVFVIYKLPGFSKNLRKEITKTCHYYFYDNGIRNAIINNFNRLNVRNDIGELWENYLIYERIKYQSYNKLRANNYFWRTYDQQEIDWVEEREGNLFAYEFKWSPNKKAKVPVAWQKAYPNAVFKVVNPENYLQWLLTGEITE